MDLQLIEEGNGGEFVKTPNDLQVIEGFQNMIYLALFGGNVKASTPDIRIATEQDFSWWGNNLFMPGDASIQFNSETERTLNEVALNSSGRTFIQQAVEDDLAFMRDFAEVVVEVKILETDKVAIGIRLIEPDNLEKQDFIFIWDATNSELVGEDSFTVTFSGNTWDFSFDVSFG